MKIGKIKPTATVVAQFPAGLEVDAIQHEGRVFLPILSMGDFGVSEDVPSSPVHVPAKKVVKEVAPVEEPEEEVPSYSEEELMEKSVKELTKILKDEFAIDPSDYPGKNTNKKLRELILGASENSEDAEEDSDEPEEPKATPKSKSKKEADDDEDEDEDSAEGSSVLDDVTKLLEDFDSGSLNKKKTIAKLVALGKDVDEDVVAGIIDNFESDDKLEIDTVAGQLSDVISGEAKKSSKKPSGGKKPKKEVLVPVEELEEGDRVSVYWEGEDFNDWYDGEVKSIKKSRKGLAVTIAYDDDTEDLIDPEIHTKIKRLA